MLYFTPDLSKKIREVHLTGELPENLNHRLHIARRVGVSVGNGAWSVQD